MNETQSQRIKRMRAENRDKAFADILNGPDNKRRRWLVQYLQNKLDKEKTELLKSVPPLVKPNQGMEATKQMHGLFEADK